MIRVILAELRKLKRRTLSLSTLASVTALTGLFTWLVYFRINEPENTRRGEHISAADLSGQVGLVYGFKLVAFLLGITALRNLLVRQPSRMKILLGKLISMKIFALVMVSLSAAISIAVSYAMSGTAKVDTTDWSTSSAYQLLGRTFVNVMISTVGYGIFGMILGLLFRSPISSIAIGVLWFLIIDNLFANFLTSSAKWLPGQNLFNVSEGGTPIMSYQHSLIVSLFYLVGGLGIVAILFKRRDVAN